MTKKTKPTPKNSTPTKKTTTPNPGPNWGRTFKNAVQQGKNPWTTVQAIAKRNQVTENRVWNFLVKNHFAFAKKFSGQTFYFPCGFNQGPKAFAKPTEFNFWQQCIVFAFQQGWVTPQQVWNWTPQQTFWFVSQKLNAYYGKPNKFNPNATVKPFNFTNPFNPPVTTTNTTTKTGTKKTVKPTPKAKKPTNKPVYTKTNPYAFPTTFQKTTNNTKKKVA